MTCGSGTETRSRDCDDPTPLPGGSCDGSGTESQSCNDEPCPGKQSYAVPLELLRTFCHYYSLQLYFDASKCIYLHAAFILTFLLRIRKVLHFN